MGVYLSQPETSKRISKGEKGLIKFVSAQMQGWRKGMQDAAIHDFQTPSLNGNYLFGVFDGHGGFQVSKYVEQVLIKELTSLPDYKNGDYEKALREAFRRVDELIDKQQGKKQLRKIRLGGGNSQDVKQGTGDDIGNSTGCTANVLLITKDKYFCANAGDSRSVLCRGGNTINLSEDHKPESQKESKRIKQAGGSIQMGRVNGGLNLSRSLGDFDYKRNPNKKYSEQMITCDPDIIVYQRHPDDEFIIMGCDGIWEQYVEDSSGMIKDLKKEIDESGKSQQKIVEDLLDRLLAKDTQSSGGIGCDNMTAILIKLK